MMKLVIQLFTENAFDLLKLFNMNLLLLNFIIIYIYSII